jgi:WD40 repeat protein
VSQLVNDYLSEYSVFPFYTFKNRAHEAIDDIIVGDSLEFIASSANESPLVSFIDSILINEGQGTVNHLYQPSEYKKYRPVRNMALQREGNTQFLYTAHGDGKIWRWQPGTQKAPDSIYHFQGRDTLIRDLAVAGDFLLVAVDSVVYEIDLRREKRVARHILGFNDAVKFLVPHPRDLSKFAVVKENSNRILMCRTNAINTIVDSFIQDMSVVTSLAFSPDGRKMIAGYEEGNIARMWDVRRRDIHTIFRGHESLISSIAFSPDGRTILTGGWDQMAVLWTDKGDIIKRLVGHQQRINSVSYTRNNYAVTCSGDGVFNVWNLNPLSQDQTYFRTRIRTMAVSSKHSKIAFSLFGEKGAIYLWDPVNDTRDTIRQPLQYRGDKAGDIVALRYSDDGRLLIAAAENWLTTLIDVSTGELVREYRGGYKGLPVTPSVTAVDVNDRYLLLADKEKRQVILQNRNDPSKFLTLKHPGRIYTARFSPNNRYVLTGCGDGNAYLWDISQQEPTYRLLKGHAARVIAVDFSSDGKYILTGSYDNSALLFQLDPNVKGALIPMFRLEGITAAFKGHSANINSVAFANKKGPDGSYYFVTGSSDKTAKYWELYNGTLQEIPNVMRHLDEIIAADFLPGDSLIVTGSYDESIQVWRAGQLDRLIRERIGLQ